MQSTEADVRQKLRYIDVSPGLNCQLFPDFLLLGPQRTGTTWLHTNLTFHPHILMPTVKEIFFLNRLDPQHPKHKTRDLREYLQHFQEPWSERWRKTWFHLRVHKELYWPRIRGEATASNAVIPPEIISDISFLNPDLKAILIIRNPVTRAWAHAKKKLFRGKGRDVSEIDDSTFKDFFVSDYQLHCGRYSQMIENWSQYLKSGHLLLLSFDDISEDPEGLLTRVFQFLGIPSQAKYIGPQARQVINRTDPTYQSHRLPAHLQGFLEEVFADELRQLPSLLGTLPVK